MNEVWKPIENEPEYEVSNTGKVRSLDKFILRKDGFKFFVKGRELKAWVSTNYLTVQLSKNKRCSVHRLVAETFIENPEKKLTVNHKDGNKSNNMVENLEWATHSENSQHAMDTGLYPLKPVTQLDKITGEVIAVYRTSTEASKKTGICLSGICSAIRGRYKTAGGYMWMV